MPKTLEGFEENQTPLNQLPVDAVVYINLDDRTDRKAEITAELQAVGIPDEKIHRLSAVKRSWGVLGCALSHESVMRFIVERGWKRVLILEDDAGFEYKSRDRWNTGVADIAKLLTSSGDSNLDSTWDVVFMGGFIRDPTGPEKTAYPTLWRTRNTSCLHAYIVRGEYAKKILSHIEASNQMLMKHPPNVKQYYVDNAMPKLMEHDRWFISIPTLAYQRESYSDIEGKNANQNEPLRGEVVKAWKAGTVL
jgi:glycosyl transferase family 25